MLWFVTTNGLSRANRESLASVLVSAQDWTVIMNLLPFSYSHAFLGLRTKIRTVLQSKLVSGVRFLYRTGKSGVYAAFVRVNIKQVPNINNVLKAGYTG